MDACINTANDASTSAKNLMNLGLVTPEFCRRVCAGRATLALPRSTVTGCLLSGRADALRISFAGPQRRQPSFVVPLTGATWTEPGRDDEVVVGGRRGSGVGRASTSADRAKRSSEPRRPTSDQSAPASGLGRRRAQTTPTSSQQDDRRTRSHVSNKAIVDVTESDILMGGQTYMIR